MRAHGWLLVFSLGLAAPAAAQVPGLDIDIRFGANLTGVSDTPETFESSDDEYGYFVGGDLRFGQFFFVQPGLYYQHQTLDLTRSGESDGLGISSIMIPLQVGLNVDLQVLEAELGIGPTVAFNTSVGDNDFDLGKDQLNNTRFGGLLSANLRVLFLTGWIGYQLDFTDTVEDGNSTLNQWMFGLGFNF
jgi:hypothetical protein